MKHPILEQLDNSSTAESMFAMGMISDAQYALSSGDLELADDILNNVKIVIDQRLAYHDEVGRHAKRSSKEETLLWAKLIAEAIKIDTKSVYQWIDSQDIDSSQLSQVFLRLRFNKIKHDDVRSAILRRDQIG